MPMEEKEVCLGGSEADLAISWTALVDAAAAEEAEVELVDATGGILGFVVLRDRFLLRFVDLHSVLSVNLV